MSSDHGVCPLHRLVKLNNLFASRGWLRFTIDEKSGEPSIDWKNTKVIYLKRANIYINPLGLDGNWKRGKGPAYEKLRAEVISALVDLKDHQGIKPVKNVVKWEDAPKFFKLPSSRVGDLVLETRLNYFWFEEVDKDLSIFSNPLTSGYKQTINPQENDCMWTPLLIWGKGVKKGHRLSKPIAHVDQLPTILKLMKIKIPKKIQGKVIKQALQ